jgi:hypothetical protein
LVISAYNHIGNEPWVDWRSVVGNTMDSLNTGPVEAVLGVTDGLRGSQQIYDNQGQHQAVRFKEVDIVGHPAAVVPQIATTEGIDTDVLFNFQVPSVQSLPTVDEASAQDEATPDDEWSIEGMLNEGFNSVMEILLEQLELLLSAFDLIRTIERIIELFTIFTDLLNFYNNAMMLLETITQSTIYAYLLNPRFQATRLFCPTSVTPFQPYYLSYLDTLFWRTGYPLTEGPISGSDHSTTILNPFSGDRMGPSGETWGHLYPRDGAVNQHMDPKAATVLAVRALDVLHNDVSDGSHTRVGVSLPFSNHRSGGYWQMIYPVSRQCQANPFYEDDSFFNDFMEENEHGGYAWNYYHIYECCMNERGTLVATMNLPQPICFDMPEALNP